MINNMNNNNNKTKTKKGKIIKKLSAISVNQFICSWPILCWGKSITMKNAILKQRLPLQSWQSCRSHEVLKSFWKQQNTKP